MNSPAPLRLLCRLKVTLKAATVTIWLDNLAEDQLLNLRIKLLPRLITLYNATSITPLSPANSSARRVTLRSVLGANSWAYWVTFGCNVTILYPSTLMGKRHNIHKPPLKQLTLAIIQIISRIRQLQPALAIFSCEVNKRVTLV